MIRAAGLIIFGMIVSACGSPRPMQAPIAAPTDQNTIEVRRSLLSGSVLLGRVSGIACASGGEVVARPVLREAALALAKQEAASIGATGLYRVRYIRQGLISECFLRDGLRATGLAFRRG
jgi:hypothetical protein